MEIKENPNYSGVLCLNTIVLPLLEEICSLLKIAFGLKGDAVMIQQNSPKEVKITKVICIFYLIEGKDNIN
jgi:hypothetical protein